MYVRIKQPATWYSWVLTNTDDFKEVSINIFQNFMNRASIKYAKIYTAQEGKFTGSDKTITGYIFIMVADSTRHQRMSSQSTLKYHKPATNKTDNKPQASVSEDTSQPKPPFTKY